MAPNVVALGAIIKHVFEACRSASARTGTCRCPPLSFATVRSHVLVIEHLSDYGFEHKSEHTHHRTHRKAPQMTIITRENPTDVVVRPARPAAQRRPRSSRPAGAPLRYHGTGVLMSRASHRRKPITPLTTVLLALVAAGITVWLGL